MLLHVHILRKRFLDFLSAVTLNEVIRMPGFTDDEVADDI